VQWLGPRRRHAPGIPFERLPRLDAVFISHNHYDHLDLPTLLRLEATHAPLFVTGLGNGAFLRERGLRRVVELDWWQHTRLNDVQLLFTPAQHWSTRGPGSRNRTLWGGAWLSQGSRSVYFCGDSGYGPLFAELRQRCGSPDIALLPIGAYEPRWFMHDQHMDPAEAVQVHRTLGAKLSVGCHFGCFPLADEGIDDPLVELASAQAALGVSRSEFLTLAPGETLLWRGASRSLHVTA
jgi:L-ascorbate metabolism protein UlaG (beta-lactamase superfamily)